MAREGCFFHEDGTCAARQKCDLSRTRCQRVVGCIFDLGLQKCVETTHFAAATSMVTNWSASLHSIEMLICGALFLFLIGSFVFLSKHYSQEMALKAHLDWSYISKYYKGYSDTIFEKKEKQEESLLDDPEKGQMQPSAQFDDPVKGEKRLKPSKGKGSKGPKAKKTSTEDSEKDTTLFRVVE